MAEKKYKDNLPAVTMQQAAELAGFSLDYGKAKTETTCPFCGKPKKFRITITSNEFPEGAAHCFRCGVHLTPIQMYAYALGLDFNSDEGIKEAAKNWYKSQRGQKTERQPKKQLSEVKVMNIQSVDVENANVYTRNATYTELLKLLTLKDCHHDNLIKRGLSEEIIKKNGYKSFPTSKKCREIIVQNLLQSGCVLEGVPGFYKGKDSWEMVDVGEGFLIPQRNGFGQIQGFQIRKDAGVRYISLSTRDMEHGSPAHAVCHLARGEKGLHEIIITEGPLKADIIAYLTGYSVLAVPGVNSLSFIPQALKDLKEKGLVQVYIAYDMDIRTNEHVQKAEQKLKGILSALSIPYTTLYWDEEDKGLDDWAVKKIKK